MNTKTRVSLGVFVLLSLLVLTGQAQAFSLNSGDILISNHGGSNIQRLEPGSGTVTSLTNIAGTPIGLAFDTNFNLYINSGPNIFKFDKVTNAITTLFVSGVGTAEGLTFDQVAARFPDLAAGLASGSASIDWPGGERASELERRIGEAWSAILAAGRPAVVVSHAGSIRVAMAIATARRADEVAFPEVASWSHHEVPAEGAPVSG